MPYNEPDATDPMTLHTTVVETEDANVQREMAACFIEEYMRMGYGRDRVLSMFKIQDYIGPHMAWRELGEAAIIELIDHQAAIWGGRRERGVAGRDDAGNVTPRAEISKTQTETEKDKAMNSPSCGHYVEGAAPTTILMDEHRVIERVLTGMERMVVNGVVDTAFLGKAVDFVRNFADGCHHAKEEDILFPVLEKAGIPRDGGPIGCMLDEHEQGRALIRLMSDNMNSAASGDEHARAVVFDAVGAFVGLLRQHIEKEDSILFVMADRVLDAAQQASMLEKFNQVEHGENLERHECYVALADELLDWKFTG